MYRCCIIGNALANRAMFIRCGDKTHAMESTRQFEFGDWCDQSNANLLFVD